MVTLNLDLDSREEEGDVSDFLDAILKGLNTNEKDFCVEMDISPASLNLIRKTRKLSLDVMRKICKRYEKSATLTITV